MKKKLKKIIINIFSLVLLFSLIESTKSNEILAKKYTESEILQTFDYDIPYLRRYNVLDTYEIPINTKYSIVTNPVTQEKIIKISAKYEDRGPKKWIFVKSLRYGGKYLGSLLEIVADKKAANFIRHNSHVLADIIDRAELMAIPYIQQPLMRAGLSQNQAYQVAWAVLQFIG